jgi:glycosyltransferase involved in cell wall biosynthesis
MRVAHFFSAYNSLGGVQSVLQFHIQRDGTNGCESELFVYNEAKTDSFERVHYIGPVGLQSIASARAKARRHLSSLRPEIAVYHGMWGMPAFADLDGASRRILVIHGDVPSLDEQLLQRAPWLDAVFCVSEPLQRRLREKVLNWDTERIGLLPYPICPVEDTLPERAPLQGRPLVIGFAGRLQKEQKRVERIPSLIRELELAGISFRFELLGSGRDQSWLESQLSGCPQVHFHGQQSGAHYWRVLRGWDVIFFASDYEGLPISLLEALSQGVIPLYPEIGCGGHQYTGMINPCLLYPPGMMGRAAAAIKRIQCEEGKSVQLLREKCRSIVMPHLGDEYIKTFVAHLRHIGELPSIVTTEFPRRSWIDDSCLLSLKNKFLAARRRWKGN